MADYADFDLDRAIEEAWSSFADRLAEVLASMDDTADLTIDSAEPSLHDEDSGKVSFHACAPDTIRAEASSNAELGEDHLLTPQDLELMEQAGWQAPETESSTTGRFWAERNQEEAADLADLAVIALRDCYGVQHPVFLAPDQLAEILTQRSQAAEAPEEAEAARNVHATVPVSREHLESMIVDELTEQLGHIPFRDEDGDYAIRVGSTMVFVRATPDHREVIVFAVVVHDVDGRSRAAEVLNDLNAESRFVRFELIRDRVFVQMSVLAHPFIGSHLRQAVKAVSDVADGVDEELAQALRGRTTFR